MPTIQDVARKAGVSVATVSRVLNNPSAVAEKTRLQVQRVMEEIDYAPSILGRNLRTSESRMFIVLLPMISNPFYVNIVEGIEETAIENGYNILLCQTHSKPERQNVYFELLRNRLADGVISMDPTLNKEKLIHLAKQFPIVHCSEYDKDKSLSYVTIDSELAAYQMTRYLLKQGHTRIALINADEKFLYARERKRGYLRALEEYKIDYDESWILTARDVSFDAGQQSMRSLLQRNQKFTAIFAVSDVLAIGALKELNIKGIRVPEEMAIAGFDKIDFSNMTYPSLTTISQPMYKMGCTAVEMLIKKTRGEKVDDVILEHELIIREST
ncbi:transcriptional regulator, LacI family [Gracilibacillus ureilyticus]|uniref:Transcriptional regulator, LacI family n=1 Tax=Gracilibacillus ureilyticus TaxID=531814 RepID=A0A1H9Q3Y9_9BACI|nr:LacI family DNA-binding transcriptional regulator [Gracilibacillus ureilyticus]SER54659.1 transcriptional regulator, LacI family [Gracilibacillus ureilyticus]